MRNRVVHIRSLLVALVWCAALPGLGQSAAQFITWGDRAAARGEHYGASRYYGEALKLQPGIMATQWKYAEACRRSNQYEEAAAFYDKVHRKDQGRQHPEALRWLAEMQMSSAKYDEAARTWAKAKQKERSKQSVIAQRADNGIEGCKLAASMANDPDQLVQVEHLPMPVNGYGSEFAARIGPDSALYFTSLRGEVDADGQVLDTLDYHARIFRSMEKLGRWNDPVPLSARVNNGSNNANGAWSADGRWFFFSREETPGEFGICALDLHGSDPARVVLRVPGHTVTQPMVAVFEGSEWLFFASDMPGGQGGMDIWWGMLIGTDLIDKKPLGPPVNTPGNEVTPFLDPSDNMLYFSSDFLPGLGGYDLFKSLLVANGPGHPINLGLPFNSPANDLYPVVDAAAGNGWFTSNRAGSFAQKGETCCNDLYRFQYPDTAKHLAAAAAQLEPLQHTTARLDSAGLADLRYRRITSLREKLPIRLYFHNDEPDPRSWATTTRQDYAATFQSYAAKKAEYDSAWRAVPGGAQAFDSFFVDQVEHGFAQLNDFTALLKQALDEGQQIKLVIRGYASPLAKSDYNKNLSLRRIATLVHHFERTDGGALLPYMNGTATNGGRLVIEERPFGKSTADASVSDRLDDLQHSVYSVGAAKERRIEIEQVE